ncbi:MAG: ATP-binding protein, partial [Promethearchaeota archaeon]
MDIGLESKPLNEEAKHTLMKEFGLEPTEDKDIEAQIEVIEEEKSGEKTDKSEIEVEEEVKKIITDMEEIIKPVESIIDDEPIVIIRLSESEAASFLTSELSQKNVMSYTFEIFDNGTGMSKTDLRKFGKYLASSKSMQLKQTRGSQGFGAPSAFSDSQNTTGKPIVAVSKSIDNVYATVSEFSTTSKNEKKYFITPTEVDCPFLHGTYIKLHYLNVKYIRGYV